MNRSSTAAMNKKQVAGEGEKCPRCDSTNTKFCYYNNYNKSQPRHFCKSCNRHWTLGGILRAVPVGGARKNNNKRLKTTHTGVAPSTSNDHDLILIPANGTQRIAPLINNTNESNPSPSSFDSFGEWESSSWSWSWSGGLDLLVSSSSTNTAAAFTVPWDDHDVDDQFDFFKP